MLPLEVRNCFLCHPHRPVLATPHTHVLVLVCSQKQLLHLERLNLAPSSTGQSLEPVSY
jgi:hypothetical protein